MSTDGEHSVSLTILARQKDMMLKTGIWPKKNPTFYDYFMETASFVLGASLTATMIIEAIDSLDNIIKLSEIIYITLTMVTCMMKLGELRKNRPRFQKIIDRFADKSFQYYPMKASCENFKSAAKLSGLVTIVYQYVCLACMIAFWVFPLIEKTKTLIFPFKYFNTGPLHYPFYCFQGIGISLSAYNNACSDLLIMGLLVTSGAHLDVLKNELQTNLNSKDPSTTELHQLCMYHNEIICMISDVENLFSFGILVQFFSSVIALCNTGFYFLLIDVYSSMFVVLLTYFMAMISQLTMYCWFGNEVILKSLEVRDCCYDSTWYEKNSADKKIMFMIMERTKRAVTVRAYGFSTLSLPTYTGIMRWSYSYYTLLKRLYDEGRVA